MSKALLGAIIIVGGLSATVAKQMPEIRRYLKIESM
jgi:hypothetical protein